jgi:biopolymer transport protein ExbB
MMRMPNLLSPGRVLAVLVIIASFAGPSASCAFAQDEGGSAGEVLTVGQLIEGGGWIGIVILVLSVAMVALIVEHLITIRRAALMPPGLAEHVYPLIMQGQFKQAEQVCRENGSLLGQILAAGLADAGLGYHAIEKAMEDAAVEQSARLFRKIEYLSVISTVAPMLGLLGTVWGMILAFMEFKAKANPQVVDLAPDISVALITTLFGLLVAVPAVASFAFFRSRVDELVAETSLLAEQVFADYRRSLVLKRRAERHSRVRSVAPPKPKTAG